MLADVSGGVSFVRSYRYDQTDWHPAVTVFAIRLAIDSLPRCSYHSFRYPACFSNMLSTLLKQRADVTSYFYAGVVFFQTSAGRKTGF